MTRSPIKSSEGRRTTFGRWADNAENRLTFGRWDRNGGRENAAARGYGGDAAFTHLRKVGGKRGKLSHLPKVSEPMTGDCAGMWHRNGSESRVLLPLWKEYGGTMPSGEPVAVVLQERRYHNGTE